MNNRKVYLIALFLVLLAGALMSAKIIYGGMSVNHQDRSELWRVRITLNIKGQGTRAKVRLTLPKENPHQTIYNEHFDNAALVFYVRERPLTNNRVGFWRAELLDDFRSLQYTFSTQMRSVRYAVPPNLWLADASKNLPPDFQIWLDPSKFIQSQDVLLKSRLRKILGREKRTDAAVRRLYDFVRGEVKYRSEKGSKDAKATLDALVADCGGQARLFAALSRAAGIPSRVVGGIILKQGVKDETHLWVENYIGGQWIPFDVVNGHYAFIPAQYLELYRGDYFLIKHLGLSRMDYFFTITPENIPPLDNPWSLYVLPIHFQSMVQALLLIPLGALIVSFFRTVVGIQTFGTFTPILLSLAFREVSLPVGLGCLALIVFFGWLLRRLLDHLKILVIPRLGILLTMVVLSILILMIASFHFGYQRMLYISLFPMVIMTWMIERYSVLEIEDGTVTALKAVVGSATVSILTYSAFSLPAVNRYLFAFPELLFIIMALLLLLGRYTGIRVMEIIRFWPLRNRQSNL